MNRRVVVTGLGAVSPVGNDVKTSWDNLISGVHGIGPITRFDTTEYKAKLAAEVRGFDARQYMEKAETLRSDLYAQYALASACQAVEESGIMGTVDPERFAVYFGSGIGGINTFTREHKKLLDRGPSRVSPYFIPMMIANMGAGMIAIRFNCQGAALPAVTACASGSNAIGEAVRAIRHGYADAVISGGAEASINECGVAGFINMQALSVSDNIDAASLPFDKRRAGFIIGEGAAALVLEEYEHAVNRGARIYGEISGYGSTCDAYHITAPLPDAAGGARAMKQALEESGYTGEEKLYINAHGTGTPLNDSGETIAIKTALGEEKAYQSYVSSTKSMTGHMLGAAGAMEAIVCLKVLETGIIPPTLNLLEADPACDLNYVPNQAVKADIDLCLSNSLGFGGHNACLAFRKV
ncbi:beta-ketoacyl-[acyl-carrier-protein] synthase II [Lachnoclostridium sp. An131]|uniref:beta-ketoacyl-ACP synthase II n=1 Tax=Lachnoclostridium sp. An131 TaxID=1965555 RepID=UPI000B54E9DF|nr:beta-ketoacyl-[acyl-carrier-protein] synthase II [Lachnoclostridium sp. An131]